MWYSFFILNQVVRALWEQLRAWPMVLPRALRTERQPFDSFMEQYEGMNLCLSNCSGCSLRWGDCHGDHQYFQCQRGPGCVHISSEPDVDPGRDLDWVVLRRLCPGEPLLRQFTPSSDRQPQKVRGPREKPARWCSSSSETLLLRDFFQSKSLRDEECYQSKSHLWTFSTPGKFSGQWQLHQSSEGFLVLPSPPSNVLTMNKLEVALKTGKGNKRSNREDRGHQLCISLPLHMSQSDAGVGDREKRVLEIE